MPDEILCSNCASLNSADATHCRSCGGRLEATPGPSPEGLNVFLHRVMGGEVYTAVFGEAGRKTAPVPRGPRTAGRPAPPASDVPAVTPAPHEGAPVEDHSDVVAAAVDRIRARAHEGGQRFRPYVRARNRGPATPQSREELGKYLEAGVGLLRERRFEEAIEPLLKAIARDDEDRRPWILLGEAYVRVDRPYQAAVAYLRSLELSPKDEQAWLGLGRVLRGLDELPTASQVLERATHLHPGHADTWAERGVVLAGMQKLPEANRALRKALELRPDHRLALAKLQDIEADLKLRGGPDAGAEPVNGEGPRAEPTAGESTAEAEILQEIDETLGEEDSVPARSPAADGTQPATSPPGPSKRPARVRTFVEGLDDTLEGGIPWGHVVLLEGAPGTMKSSLAFSILLHNAAREGLHCLYLSLEERASSLLKQMGSLGLRLDVPKGGSLVVLDPRTASDLIGEKSDWVHGLEEGIRSIKQQQGLDLIAIDSLEALEVLAKFNDRRREMYRLFEWLRDLDVTSFVVTERPDWLIAGHVLQGRWDEDFLADGVLHLRIHMVSDLEAQRRLRVVKMRGTKHETGYLAMVLDEGGFRVTRAMSP